MKDIGSTVTYSIFSSTLDVSFSTFYSYSISYAAFSEPSNGLWVYQEKYIYQKNPKQFIYNN